MIFKILLFIYLVQSLKSCSYYFSTNSIVLGEQRPAFSPRKGTDFCLCAPGHHLQLVALSRILSSGIKRPVLGSHHSPPYGTEDNKQLRKKKLIECVTHLKAIFCRVCSSFHRKRRVTSKVKCYYSCHKAYGELVIYLHWLSILATRWKAPIPVPVRSKAWVCGCSLAGIAGSNPAEGMDVCCECCVLSDRSLCDSADDSSRGVLPSIVCLTGFDVETSTVRRPRAY